MRGKIQVRPELVSILYVITFISAIGQLRYQLYQQDIWYTVYRYSVYLMVVTCLVYIGLSLVVYKGKIHLFVVVLLLFIVYEVFVSLFSNMLYIRLIIIDVLPWPMVFAVFYDYCRQRELPKFFSVITILGLSIISFLSVPNVMRHLIDYGRRGGVIFPIYYGIGYLAMALLLCGKRMRYVFMAITSSLLIVSTKRTGAAAVIVGLVAYFLCDAFIANTLKEKLKKYSKFIVLGLIAFFVGIYLINRYNISIIERFYSMVEDGGSNRKYIWADVMQHFYDSSLIRKMIGHGFHAVYYKIQPYGYPRMAHNSFMETLYDYGLLGFIFLVDIVFYLVYKTFKMVKDRSRYASVMIYTMVPMMFLGVFSYFFEQTVIIIPFVVVWGVCIGSFIRERKESSMVKEKEWYNKNFACKDGKL